jgi:fused signal recognition particle receptor
MYTYFLIDVVPPSRGDIIGGLTGHPLTLGLVVLAAIVVALFIAGWRRRAAKQRREAKGSARQLSSRLGGGPERLKKGPAEGRVTAVPAPSEKPTEKKEAEPADLSKGLPKAPAKELGKAAAAPERRELALGLAKTRAGFIARIGELLRRKQIDEDLLAQLEEVLLAADIGVKTAQSLFEQVRATLSRQELKDPEAVWSVIKAESRRLLTVDAPPLDWNRSKPFVVLIIGVNGVGKTTTIGKLAAQRMQEGQKVVLAAGDTFRAAAVEQLEIWAQRAGAAIVKGKEGGDPSAVVFDAVRRAQGAGPSGPSDKADVVIADTAGRLHVKAQLMEELQKVRRVLKKADPTAPHETFLVLDATNGQNAIAQAKAFKDAMEITGIILTKLDGTAKGGVILGIAHELGVPVRYIGIGEKIHDLRAFDSADFVDVLYEQVDSQAS